MRKNSSGSISDFVRSLLHLARAVMVLRGGKLKHSQGVIVDDALLPPI